MDYLEEELHELIRRDLSVFGILQVVSLDGIWYWDIEKPSNIWMSSRFWEILGFNVNTSLPLPGNWKEYIFQEDLDVIIDVYHKYIMDSKHLFDLEVRYHHQDGSTVWIRCRGVAIRNEDGKPIRVLGTHTDITEIKKLKIEIEEKNKDLKVQRETLLQLSGNLKKMVREDMLTGLNNRLVMDEVLKIEVQHANRYESTFSVLMIDINQFKHMNDIYGTEVGDKVLVDFASRLERLLREGDCKARWGGDEFLVVLPMTQYEGAFYLANKIKNNNEVWAIKNENTRIEYSVCIGSAEFIIGETIESCIQRATIDLYDKKLRTGKTKV